MGLGPAPTLLAAELLVEVKVLVDKMGLGPAPTLLAAELLVEVIKVLVDSDGLEGKKIKTYEST